VGLVSRRYLPDPDALTAAIARRVDAIERDQATAAGEVTALGRGVAELTAEIRRLARLTPANDDTTENAADGTAEGEAPVQPDWLTVEDVETARIWLVELHRWVTEVLPGHGFTVTAPCWPLHPDVVAVLLALEVERETAYASDRPTPVTEWLTRWLPAATARIDTALAGCISERGHQHADAVYDATGLDPASVAAWWVTDRDTPAPDAFTLPRLT
jgi:hypothetical protein